MFEVNTKTPERRHQVLGFLTVKGTTPFGVNSKMWVWGKVGNSYKK